MSNIIMALTVLVTLLFLMPLFRCTPNLILAAIIVTAVIGLIDYQSAFRLWKVDKLDFLACLSSFFGVLFVFVPVGLAIAVGVSVFKILLHVTRPHTCVLGKIPGTEIFQDLVRYREAQRVPSFVVIGIEAPIYFANSTYLQERILRWLREEKDWIASNNGSILKSLIIDMTVMERPTGLPFKLEARYVGIGKKKRKQHSSSTTLLNRKEIQIWVDLHTPTNDCISDS
ncbi:hypothetical protein L1987_01608 [Smallanthus sonchifolius]|uniref:Uncharacterized protein n=1 Tax=Smallanthus sonchifolius TaxID=185202 RepID=A0ACB9K5P1_9ASTR|nr:hypothetical protein L1987_01608 [Smallanthus sonchifolius]